MSALSRRREPRTAAERLGFLGAVLALLAGVVELTGTEQHAHRVLAFVLGGCAIAAFVGAALTAVRGRWRDGAAVAAVVACAATAAMLLHLGRSFAWIQIGGSITALVVVSAGLLILSTWIAAGLTSRRPQADPTPWELIGQPASPDEADEPDESRAGAIPAAVSVLTLTAVIWVLTGAFRADIDAPGVALLPPVGVLVLLVVVAIPLVRRERRRRRAVAAQHAQAIQRQQVGAYLHDSVLQTLALIQRTDDPGEIASLARQQERALRDWLAGRDEDPASGVAAALRAVSAEVEVASPGSVIECVVVGDAPLGGEVSSIIWAAREALRNATRHAAGSEIRVFAEVEPHAITVYVRDTGPGFDPAQVPAERRGVRDAIVGRMHLAGGSAEIDTGPAGTEITLTLPTTPGSRGGRAGRGAR